MSDRNLERSDTIVAIATAPGVGAVAIVRLSGRAALALATVVSAAPLRPRYAHLRELRTAAGELIDQALVIAFPGPDSFTGEDVVEFHTHGGEVVSDWLVSELCQAGARQARPGEFTLRAFLNDKLDLAQAEAVADLVASGSRTAARAATRSLQGEFSALVVNVQDRLTRLRVQVEAHLDFPEEEIEPAHAEALQAELAAVRNVLRQVAVQAQAGRRLQDGLNIAIAGPPNAGKSSLLNRLAGYAAAIVTPTAGTTRDPLRERIVFGGLPVNIVDTAGLRLSDDPIETEGVRRARAETERADLVLWVDEASLGEAAVTAGCLAELGPAAPVLVVLNKTDLLPADALTGLSATGQVAVSALTGAGIDTLVRRIREAAGLGEAAEGSFSARRRHLDSLAMTLQHLGAAATELPGSLELAAEELRAAQAALGELTGEHSSDDLLGEIFSSFCIGK